MTRDDVIAMADQAVELCKKQRSRKTAEERFWEKVEFIPIAGCWVWSGAAQHNGYGFLHIGGKTARKQVRAHRFSWEIHIGPIPEGMHVCHRCDNPACVNPHHLFIGSRSDNMKDCANKGRINTTGKRNITHCINGHAFTEENTIYRPNGHRRCKACRDAIQLASKERRRSEAILSRNNQGNQQ